MQSTHNIYIYIQLGTLTRPKSRSPACKAHTTYSYSLAHLQDPKAGHQHAKHTQHIHTAWHTYKTRKQVASMQSTHNIYTYIQLGTLTRPESRSPACKAHTTYTYSLAHLQDPKAGHQHAKHTQHIHTAWHTYKTRKQVASMQSTHNIYTYIQLGTLRRPESRSPACKAHTTYTYTYSFAHLQDPKAASHSSAAVNC